MNDLCGSSMNRGNANFPTNGWKSWLQVGAGGWRGILLLVAVCFLPLVQATETLTQEDKDKFMHIALNIFWERAVDRDGKHFKPINEDDKNTLPISKTTANQVIKVGEISGYVRWCGLDWEKDFLKMTSTARASGFTDKQMSYISMLHGLMQGFVKDAMQRSGRECGVEERNKVQYLQAQSPSSSIKADLD
jgi:hypothetical protein